MSRSFSLHTFSSSSVSGTNVNLSEMFSGCFKTAGSSKVIWNWIWPKSTRRNLSVTRSCSE